MQTHHRKQLRIPGYDYTRSGAYFITICTWKRCRFFGNIVDGGMIMVDCGQIAFDCWNALPDHFPNIELGGFVVMPNHVHGILIIAGDCRGSACRTPTVEQYGKPIPGSIPTIIRSYKSAVINHIHRLPDYIDLQIWQRNYYEHIIRSDDEWARIDAYIESNPMNWTKDRLFGN